MGEQLRWHQRFDRTFELSWKTLKDYREPARVTAQFPRGVIKEAFRAGLIDRLEKDA